VAESFGAIALDNRRFLVMEWIAKGVMHTPIGVLVILATAIDGAADSTTELPTICCVSRILALLAAITAASGASAVSHN